MRAVVLDRYGPPERLAIRDVPAPQPAAGQARVRVHAASVNPIDCRIRSGSLRLVFPQRFPLVLGSDLAGEVEAVGPGVGGLEVGDRVYGAVDRRSSGAYAELAICSAAVLAPAPEGLTYVEAASLPLVSLTALQALRAAGRVGPGRRVLVNGASGGVGTAAVQIACALGASVTGVCSAGNAELVRGLGAAEVVDYNEADFTRGTERYDVVLDVVANRSFGQCRRVLERDGRYVTLYPSPAAVFWMLATRLSPRRALLFDTTPSGEDLREITALVEAGSLRPVLEEVLPLERVVEAHRRSETGHARGKIVLSLDAAAGPHTPGGRVSAGAPL